MTTLTETNIDLSLNPQPLNKPQKSNDSDDAESAHKKETARRSLLLRLARHIVDSPAVDAKLSTDIFEMIREPLESDILFNYRLTARGDLELLAEVGVPEHLKAEAARLDLGQAFCGNVAATKTPLSANRERICSDTAGAFVLQMGVTAYACHPLFGRDGKVLGTFSVASSTRTEFTPSEIDLLQTISHFLAIAWDRHQAEIQVADLSVESERQKRLYETILSNTPDLTYVFDLNHRFTYANKILLAMWGKTWDEAIGKNCLELGYEPWHAEMHSREIEQVKKTKLPIRGEVPFEGTFGRRIYDYIFVPILDKNGEVEAVAGTTRDITELKQAQEYTAKRLENEKEHAILIGKVAEASQSINRLLSAKSITQTLAEKAREIICAHKALVEIYTLDDTQCIYTESFSEEYLAKTTERHNFHLQHTNERNSISVPLTGKGQQTLGALTLIEKCEGDFSDDDKTILTQLAAIAAAGIENATLYEKLQEQDRRKDEFIAMLAHELRNPLAPVRNAVAVLEQSSLLDTDRKTLGMMDRQINHMVHLIDDLLDVSRISRGKIELRKEIIRLEKIIESALEVSQLAIAANQQELIIVREIENIELDADPIRLAQVMTNLLNNATKYTPVGGRIELILKQEGNEAVIQVKDNGLGINPAMIPKVFELFTQANDTAGNMQVGLGIGLAISKQLVEMHGGSLHAESEGENKGATFTVRLPTSQSNCALTSVETSPTTQSNVSPHKILIVDDNADAADTLSMFLQMLGHHTQVAYGGPEAIKWVNENKPDLVLLDIGLPEMNGYEVARYIISTHGDERPFLVALTGWGTMEDKQRARDAGFDDHFTKPIELQKVIQLFDKIWGTASKNIYKPIKPKH